MSQIKVRENSDKELVNKIRNQIKANKGHCCCAIVFNDDNLCMCKEFRSQIKNKKEGFCHCGLYEAIKVDK